MILPVGGDSQPVTTRPLWIDRKQEEQESYEIREPFPKSINAMQTKKATLSQLFTPSWFPPFAYLSACASFSAIFLKQGFASCVNSCRIPDLTPLCLKHLSKFFRIRKISTRSLIISKQAQDCYHSSS